MTTLADLNKTLQEQNLLLDAVSKNTDNTKEGILDLANKLGMSLPKQENQYEDAKKEKKKVESKASSFLAVSGGLGFGLPGFIGGGLIGALFSGLGKIGGKGILAIAGTYLADAVGDYIERGGGSEELADTARRAITGGALGSIFGFKFGLIGAALAAVIDEEAAAKLKVIGEGIAGKLPYLGVLFEDLGIYVPSLSDATKTVNEALDSVIGLMEGDMLTFTENLGSLLLAIGFPLALLGKGKIRAVGAVLTALGLSFNFMEEELGPVTAALLNGFGLLSLGAFAFRKKIVDFLRRMKPDLDKFDKPKPKPGAGTVLEEKPNKKLPTQADILDERLKNQKLAEQQERSFKNRLSKLFTGLNLPKILAKIPKGPVGAALMLAPSIAEGFTEQDPNLYGLGDFSRDILGVAESIGKFFYNPIPSPGAGVKLREPGIEDYFRAAPLSGAAIDEFSNMFGPTGQFLPQPGAGTVLAPQVDASTTSIDQSQSALIKMDPHISPTNPFTFYVY